MIPFLKHSIELVIYNALSLYDNNAATLLTYNNSTSSMLLFQSLFIAGSIQ